MNNNETTPEMNEVTAVDSNNAEKKGFSIASMVCGIISLVLCCSKLLSTILAIVSLVLGSISIKKQYGGRNMAVAGIVCSIIALALVILSYVYGLATGFALTSLLS